jgi:predicted ATPase
MRIAFTGASSTGKTTLALALEAEREFAVVAPARLNVDARRLLLNLGFTSGIDSMSREDRRAFQRRYFTEKRQNEDGRTDYFTERSFVDIAAFWIDTSTDPDELTSDFVNECEMAARWYDLHVYLPVGVIPLEADGLRSNSAAYHSAIDSSVRRLLQRWRLRYVELRDPAIGTRVGQVLQALGERS